MGLVARYTNIIIGANDLCGLTRVNNKNNVK
jgi:hypothetical protein